MDLLILGASVRAARHSASRAGLSSSGFDLFADRDNPPDPPTGRIDPEAFPDGFASMAESVTHARPGPWMYTGAMENHPDVVDRIAAIRPLWGISGPSLRAVRDPIAVADGLGRNGLPSPGVRIEPGGLPRDGSWLVKPLASAGGRRIRPLIERAASPQIGQSRTSYYQERIDGPSLAALFVANRDGATLFGVTRQLIGRDGNPFAYTGSLGPWGIGDRPRELIARIGEALASEFGLRGLFGVDLILRGDGVPFPVEVNPRYTASVEVLELATGRSALREHGRAFDPSLAPAASLARRRPSFVGKAILFADGRSTLPRVDGWQPRALGSFAASPVADVPAEGSIFEAGEPILTVMARGSSLASCEARLRGRLWRWRSRLMRS